MPNVSSPAALPQYIEQLLSQHKAHTLALKEIETTLAKVTAALGGSPAAPAAAAPAPAKRGRPFKNPAMAALKAPVAAPKPAASKPGRKPAKTGGLTANEFVLAFVKDKKNPTTQEINKHWKEAGRSGVADNSLSILTRAKKLKRLPLGEGVRGSRYMVA